MTGKTVLVTGGIGKATAIGLAALGAHVGILLRDESQLGGGQLERHRKRP
jgi:NAD(P)-dependent dehydrogenase (short-subunit alcohol dehydrogenase family)